MSSLVHQRIGPSVAYRRPSQITKEPFWYRRANLWLCAMPFADFPVCVDGAIETPWDRTVTRYGELLEQLD
jgi:hypothetical protein